MDSKKGIRNRISTLRHSMTDSEWDRKTQLIFQKIVSHPLFVKADTIFCYVDYHREVGTTKIIEKAWECKKEVAVPKIADGEMNFYKITSFAELQKGYKGIYEPVAGTVVSNTENVLVILPGVAFDKTLHRIGYGKGYYDKFLQKHPEYRTIALAFEFQVLSQIPADSYDVCPNFIITEDNIYD